MIGRGRGGDRDKFLFPFLDQKKSSFEILAPKAKK
jgi:hypothetical protein